LFLFSFSKSLGRFTLFNECLEGIRGLAWQGSEHVCGLCKWCLQHASELSEHDFAWWKIGKRLEIFR